MLFLIFLSISGDVARITISNFKDSIILLFVVLNLILIGHLLIYFNIIIILNHIFLNILSKFIFQKKFEI